jgi:hypothetical protein
MAVEEAINKATSKIKEEVVDKVKAQVKNLIKTYGWGFVVKGIPIIGDFWPGFSLRVYKEMKNSNTGFPSADELLMLPLAVFFDVLMGAIGVLGDWWGFSDYGSVGWVGWIIFGVWIYLRTGGVTGFKGDKEIGETPPEEEKPEEEKTPEEKEKDAKKKEEGKEEGKKKGDEKRKTPADMREGAKSADTSKFGDRAKGIPKSGSGFKLPGKK